MSASGQLFQLADGGDAGMRGRHGRTVSGSVKKPSCRHRGRIDQLFTSRNCGGLDGPNGQEVDLLGCFMGSVSTLPNRCFPIASQRATTFLFVA